MPIDTILAMYNNLDENGFLDIMVEPPISVIEDDLDKAEQTYWIRRNWHKNLIMI